MLYGKICIDFLQRYSESYMNLQAFCVRLSSRAEKDPQMTAAASFFRKKKVFKAQTIHKERPMEIVNRIKKELEKSGMSTSFIGTKAEDLLARVYFPTVN